MIGVSCEWDRKVMQWSKSLLKSNIAWETRMKRETRPQALNQARA